MNMSYKTFEEYFEEIHELETTKMKKQKEHIEAKLKEIKRNNAFNNQNKRTRDFLSRVTSRKK